MDKENEIDGLLERIILDKEKAINELLCVLNNTDDCDAVYSTAYEFT